MGDEAAEELVEAFMASPLVMWVRTFEDRVEDRGDPQTPSIEAQNASTEMCCEFLRLAEGTFLNKVMGMIDFNPRVVQMNSRNRGKHQLFLLRQHLQAFYQEELQQLILMPFPDISVLSRDPLSEQGVEEMRRLLLLMLGCAVQCEQKDEFIETIQALSIEMQAAIAGHIQEVTQDLNYVFPLQCSELANLPHGHLEDTFQTMVQHLQRLLQECVGRAEVIAELTQEKELLLSQGSSSILTSDGPPSDSTLRENRQHLTVQLADAKAKLRRMRQEMDEKGEQLLDYEQDVQDLQEELKKLRQENRQLLSDARLVRVYRDEVDALREKAGRVEKLQGEVKAYKERLPSLEMYKSKLEEEREYSQALLETKNMLEEQLEAARSRFDKLHEMEKENLFLRSRLRDLELERDSDRQKVADLLQENLSLEVELKHSMEETIDQHWEVESDLETPTEMYSELKSLSYEVNEVSCGQLLSLERENQELRKRLQVLEDTLACRDQAMINVQTQALQQENHSLAQSVKQLEEKLQQERAFGESAEKLSSSMLLEKERLEQALQTLQAQTSRESRDLTLQNERLSQTLESLRQRSQVGTDARVKDLEKENQVLHDTMTANSVHASKLEYERAQLQREVEELRERTARSEETEKLLHHLETQHKQLQKKLLQQEVTCQQAGLLEQRLLELEGKNTALKRSLDGMKQVSHQLKDTEKENSQLDEENILLRKMVEQQKLENALLRQLEEENQELEKERESLRRSLEGQRAAVKKGEQREISLQALQAESLRMQKQLENSRRKTVETELELQEAEEEIQRLQRFLEEQRTSVQHLEQDKEDIELRLGQAEKDKKQLEKESRRFRQQAEAKDTVLEEQKAKLVTLEQQNRLLNAEVERHKEGSTQVKEMQQDNRELKQQLSLHHTTMGTLREDLMTEKVKVHELETELTRLRSQLERIPPRDEQQSSESSSRYQTLEQRLEISFRAMLQMKEDQLNVQREQLGELLNINQQLSEELQRVKRTQHRWNLQQETQQKPMSGKEEMITENDSHRSWERNMDMEVNVSQSAKEKIVDDVNIMRSGEDELVKKEGLIPWPVEEKMVEKEAHGGHSSVHSKAEAVGERLIELERNNATLATEKHALLSQVKQLESQLGNMQSQILMLQKHSLSIQEQTGGLQALNTRLQVENSALSSQNASLSTQASQLQSRLSVLESEERAALKDREETRAQHEALLKDHERLAQLHERQGTDMEGLMEKHGKLKAAQRALELEHRDLESRFSQLMAQKAHLEELEGSLKAEQERLELDARKHRALEEDHLRLQEDVDRLKKSLSKARQEQEELLIEHRALKSQLNSMQLEKTRLEAECSGVREQNQQMDIRVTKLGNQCELMAQLKGNLEEENRHLLQQIQAVTQENRTLMERTMESKDLFHEEQRLYQDKLNELRREKQKLVEKIMDQYRVLEPTLPKSKKTNWIADKMKKLIKPRKEGARERLRVPAIELGSSENLVTLLHNEGLQGRPFSAPNSPIILRRASSSAVTLDPHRLQAHVHNRRLSSRMSQSFTPGDGVGLPRERFRQRRLGWYERSREEAAPGAPRPVSGDSGVLEEERVSPEDLDQALNTESSGSSREGLSLTEENNSPTVNKLCP
ncbi:coiled-coil domain-containing protein 88B isoform X2 [Ambystoma mexicanum]|uniref:coiled-coil domain-containing protein 88B isoform X2 n=1 Tax=Ambystoma mexicanum TaxID=8296 RepID=UPI0037E852D9